jgi:hypothetical protein
MPGRIKHGFLRAFDEQKKLAAGAAAESSLTQNPSAATEAKATNK